MTIVCTFLTLFLEFTTMSRAKKNLGIGRVVNHWRMHLVKSMSYSLERRIVHHVDDTIKGTVFTCHILALSG